jgi:hypothetical protein
MLTTGRRRSEESQAAGGEALGPNFRYPQDVNGRLIQWCVARMCPPSPHRCSRILIAAAHCRYNNNKQAYFTYDGSLTTPDCNEQVRWHI